MRERYLGMMCGSSLDGIDVALVTVEDPFRINLNAFQCLPFATGVREEILALMEREECPWHLMVAAHGALGNIFADAALRFLKDHPVGEPGIKAIGLHGVTFAHLPHGHKVFGEEGRGTLQLADPHVLCQRTSLPVIFDFRHKDMALGGQGAPLAPFLDHLLFRHPQKRRVLLNLGGIANLTILDPGNPHVVAFDSGPANMVIDALMNCHPTEPGPFDPDGRFGAQGKVLEPLLNQCLQHPYFGLPAPKSTGRETFGAEFTGQFLSYGKAAAHEDLLATATRLTALTIAQGLQQVVPPPYENGDALVASGGGVHNKTLLTMLAAALPGMKIETVADYGLSADAKEGVLMAALAWAHEHQIPANLPSVTGASEKVILGAKVSP